MPSPGFPPDAFPCSQCGLCCQRVGRSPLTDFLDRGDGVCTHFDAVTRLCAVYDRRPMVCRVEAAHNVIAPHLDRTDYYKANAEICNQLQEETGMSLNFRVIIQE